MRRSRNAASRETFSESERDHENIREVVAGFWAAVSSALVALSNWSAGNLSADAARKGRELPAPNCRNIRRRNTLSRSSALICK